MNGKVREKEGQPAPAWFLVLTDRPNVLLGTPARVTGSLGYSHSHSSIIIIIIGIVVTIITIIIMIVIILFLELSRRIILHL